MIKKLVLVSASLTLMSCAATVTQTDSGPYAPKTNKPGSGTVAYNPDGMNEFVQSRRQDALRKIYEICGSNNYKITHEEIKPVSKSAGALANLGASRLNYLDFQCTPPKSKAKDDAG